MTEQQQREALKKAYAHSQSWAEKVDRMSRRQLAAIYLKFKAQGKLG